MAGINPIGIPNPQAFQAAGSQNAVGAAPSGQPQMATGARRTDMESLLSMPPEELDLMLGSLLQTFQALLGSQDEPKKDISPAKAYLRGLGAFMVRPLEESQAKTKPEAQVFASYDNY